jgi:hypothetical protein
MSSPSAPPPEPTPFDKFRTLTRKLIAVPKAEVVAEEKKYKQLKARRAKKKKDK